MAKKSVATDRRQARVRRALKVVGNGRPRLSVFRSGRHIYAQVIADDEGKTLAAASSIDTDLKGNPSARRDGLAIRFWCESCDARPVLTIAQHKGSTLVEFSE